MHAARRRHCNDCMTNDCMSSVNEANYASTVGYSRHLAASIAGSSIRRYSTSILSAQTVCILWRFSVDITLLTLHPITPLSLSSISNPSGNRSSCLSDAAWFAASRLKVDMSLTRLRRLSIPVLGEGGLAHQGANWASIQYVQPHDHS